MFKQTKKKLHFLSKQIIARKEILIQQNVSKEIKRVKKK